MPPGPVIGFDTETHLIRRGLVVPRLVCTTLSGTPGGWVGPHAREHANGWLLTGELAAQVPLDLLAGGATLVAHNAPYDLAVLLRAAGEYGWGAHACEDIWRALFEGRVIDTRIRERLIRIAYGELECSISRGPAGPAFGRTRFDLAGLVARYRGVELGGKSGGDAWRLRYSELDGVPAHLWPEAAVDYAVLDAHWAREVASDQLDAYPAVLGAYATRTERRGGRIHAEERETLAAWALHLWSCWGLRTDPDRVRTTLGMWGDRAAAGRAVGVERGWVRSVGSVDKKALQAAVTAAYNGRPPRTAPTKSFPQGQVKTDAETLLASGFPPLVAYAASLSWTLVAQRWAHVLPLGVVRGISYRPESLIETGRTSVSDPAWQQPPRDGGVRECVVPRPGWVLCSVDYDAAELVALAQVCIWAGLGSRLGDLINAGLDPHLDVAAELLGLTYDEAKARKAAGDPEVVNARQIAKALNFGLPGGLQAAGFLGFAAGYNIKLTLERAEELVAWWHRQKPEIKAYFDWVQALLGDDGLVQHPVSLRLRGGTRYTAALNGYFQGLVADGAKYASVVLTAACMGVVHPDLAAGRLPGISADEAASLVATLAGACRPVLFLHDEVLSEVLEARATAVADAKARILVAGMQRHMPDVRCGGAPTLMRLWSKAAKSKRTKDGWSVWAPEETSP